MNFVVGSILFVAVALILAMVLYAFLSRQERSGPKTGGQGKRSKQKLTPGRESVSKIKIPEKVLKKPSALPPILERDQLSPGGRLAVDVIRVVVEKDAERVVRIIRRWMKEK